MASPNSTTLQSPDSTSDWLESPDLRAPLDVVLHLPPTDDVAARIQALEATLGLAFITFDEIHQVQAADDNL